jgi:integrase
MRRFEGGSRGVEEVVESLFSHITKRGKTGYWSTARWTKLKKQIEMASGVEFRWKDLRPTYAQRPKDLGAPIEAVSKCLRHTDTRTTERYCARIRNETAFSLVRQIWETPVAKFHSGKTEK